MAVVEEFNDESFASAVKAGVVLVDFWAPWCGPCIPQGRIVEEVAETVAPDVRIAKISVDESPRLASHFDIRAIPTLIVFRDGEVMQRFVGVTMGSQLVSAIEDAQTR